MRYTTLYKHLLREKGSVKFGVIAGIVREITENEFTVLSAINKLLGKLQYIQANIFIQARTSIASAAFLHIHHTSTTYPQTTHPYVLVPLHIYS